MSKDEIMESIEKVETLSYSGIFLSCYSNDNTSCVHATKDHTLLYLYSGEHVIDQRGEQTVIHPGECAFIRRDHRVTMYKNHTEKEQYKGISLTFRRNVLREFYNKLDKNEIPKDVAIPDRSVFRLEPSPQITSLFQSLTPYFASDQKPSEQIIQLKFQEGIYALLSAGKEFFPMLFDFTEPWKIDIMEFLEENYMYELSMEEIASYTGRSLATFKRDFAKISDLTPQKWLINKRLEVAHDLLTNQNMKVSDVYVDVGFKNLSHFYAAFKKQFGYSPRK